MNHGYAQKYLKSKTKYLVFQSRQKLLLLHILTDQYLEKLSAFFCVLFEARERERILKQCGLLLGGNGYYGDDTERECLLQGGC